MVEERDIFDLDHDEHLIALRHAGEDANGPVARAAITWAIEEILRLRSEALKAKEAGEKLIIAAEKAAFAIDGIMPAHVGQAEHGELKDAFDSLEAALSATTPAKEEGT